MFDRGLQWLKDGIVEGRRLIGGLRPPVLDDAGLVPAIDVVIAELEKAGGPRRFISTAKSSLRVCRT